MGLLRGGTGETARGRPLRPPRTLYMSPVQSALLLNLLSDNARSWNAPLRVQLHEQVTPTEVLNAADDLRNGRV